MTIKNGAEKYQSSHGRLSRRRWVQRSCALILAGVFGAAGSASADDPDPGSDDSSMQLLQNLQSLEKANGDKQLMETGFTALETYSGMLGQPEVTFAIKGLQNVLDFTGAFSGESNSATAEALKTLSIQVAEIQVQLDAMKLAQNQTAGAVVTDHNRALRKSIDDIHAELAIELRTLYPPSDSIIKSRRLSPNGPIAAAPVSVSPDVARDVAFRVALTMNKFVDDEDSYFMGDDLKDDGHGNKSPVSGLKPFPALNIYLTALKLYVTALEVISGGTEAGHRAILNDRGEPNRRPYVVELKRQATFLRTAFKGGSDDTHTQPLQDRIMAQESCSWQVSGGGGGGSNYPDRAGTCRASVMCPDDISRRVVLLSTTYKQQDTNSFCQFDPASQALSSGGTAPDFMAPIDKAVRLQYGLSAMDRMADILSLVAVTGTAVQTAGLAGGNFGHTASKAFFAYGVGALGAVKSYAGSNSQGLLKANPVGFMPDIVALIPGGNSVFYTVTKDGKLNWYQFTGNANSKPYQGPVTVGSGFGGYRQVIGGSEGIIYAIQNDGTLLWFRHDGYATGNGSVSAPKTVGSGWAQFKQVFAAGHGILYGVKSDGSVLWYRHQDYLTGDSVTEATGGSAPSPVSAAGPTATRLGDSRFHRSTGRSLQSLPNANPNTLGARVPTAHWDGPVQVASWPDYVRIMGAGEGVVLALQRDGKLQWYRHDDYLTGTSTSQPHNGNAASGATDRSPWGATTVGTSDNAVRNAWASAPSSSSSGSTSTPNWGAQNANRSSFGGGSSESFGGSKSRFGSSAYAASQNGAETITAGGSSSGQRAQTSFGPNDVSRQPLAGKAHWEGPTLIDPHSGWEAFNDLAASLPAASASVIK